MSSRGAGSSTYRSGASTTLGARHESSERSRSRWKPGRCRSGITCFCIQERGCPRAIVNYSSSGREGREWDAVRGSLPAALAMVCEVAYITGWRLKAEIRGSGVSRTLARRASIVYECIFELIDFAIFREVDFRGYRGSPPN